MGVDAHAAYGRLLRSSIPITGTGIIQHHTCLGGTRKLSNSSISVAAGPCHLHRGLLSAVAGSIHWYFGAGQGLVELLLDEQRFHGLTAPAQAFVQAVQAPQITQMLAGAAQGVVQAQ